MPLKKVNFIKMVHHIKHVDDTDFNFQIYTLFCSGHVTLEELLDATNLCKKLTLTKIEVQIVYFLYTKSIQILYYIGCVYIFSIHQIYIKPKFTLLFHI